MIRAYLCVTFTCRRGERPENAQFAIGYGESRERPVIPNTECIVLAEASSLTPPEATELLVRTAEKDPYLSWILRVMNLSSSQEENWTRMEGPGTMNLIVGVRQVTDPVRSPKPITELDSVEIVPRSAAYIVWNTHSHFPILRANGSGIHAQKTIEGLMEREPKLAWLQLFL